MQVGGPTRFVDWLQGLTREKLQEISQSYTAYTAAERAWRSQPKNLPARKPKPVRAYNATKVNQRVATGLAYLKWREAEGATSSSFRKAWGCRSDAWYVLAEAPASVLRPGADAKHSLRVGLGCLGVGC